MIYFVAYDISSPKRLVKAAKILESFGLRVQKSFFECEMKKENMEKLKSTLLEIIDEKVDSLHIYPVCEDCLRLTQTLGYGSVFVPSTYQII